jgi:hypothetical protein
MFSVRLRERERVPSFQSKQQQPGMMPGYVARRHSKSQTEKKLFLFFYSSAA